jgi:UDP-N-acetylglucosamine--N-acetylmuramyl-(pentapeptide) pyrophosphoryl-undecaprenol N-acetylglucosamine transferase
VEAAGFSFTPVWGGKLRRYFSWQNFVAPGQTLAGVVQSWQRLGQWRPDVVLTAGSFVAVPVVWAAALRRIPIVVHHQDVEVGLANRLMFPFARVVTSVFPVRPGLPARTMVTGNPVRQPFLQSWTEDAKVCARLRFGLNADAPVLVVVGGSSGASGLNRLVIHALPRLLEFCQVLHVTGQGKSMLVGQHAGYYAVSFISSASEMAEVLAIGTAVVSRAGMGSLSELAALRAAAILAPLPGHQQSNATYVASRHGAAVVDQATITPESFVATIRQVLDESVTGSAVQERLAAVLPTVSGADYFERVVQLLR